MLEIPLLKSLSEINYGNAIQCVLWKFNSDPPEYQEALPFIREFLKKVTVLPLIEPLPVIEPPSQKSIEKIEPGGCNRDNMVRT